MAALRFAPFGGMVPAVDDTLLPDGAAAYSRDAYLYDGALRGLPVLKLIHTCAEPKATRAFRIPNNYTDKIHLEDAVWLEFENPDTDVIHGLVVGDTFDRYYWASSASPPRYSTRARIKAGSDPFILGIPNPTVGPVVAASGGTSDVVQSRAYVYTWVSAYGEEGPPSPPSVVTNGKQDDTWALTLSAAAASDLGVNRNLAKTRIYRTVTGSDGTTTYFFVAELDIATLTYDDTTPDATVTANNQLQSTTWSAPPADLKGIVAMPNGIVAGFRDTEVWFCEPYRPHAWPATYTLAVDSPIVGLGVVGQTLVVCTSTSPYLIYGADPASMAQSKVQTVEPCMSRGSILSSLEGVYYASPNGLILVTNGAATNVTRDTISKEKWQQLSPVATMRAARLATGYYGFGTARFGVFNNDAYEETAVAQDDFSESFKGVLLDGNQRIGLNILSASEPCVSIWNDVWSGELFYMVEGKVYWLDISTPAQEQSKYLWRSKLFQAPQKKNFEAIKVYFDTDAGTPAQGAARSIEPTTLADDQYGIIRVYADGRLVTSRELWVSGELMRIPSGFKADFWQIELEARVRVRNVQLASTAKELADV